MSAILIGVLAGLALDALLVAGPASEALAEGAPTGGLLSLIQETPPNSIITHEKGSLEWIETNPESYEFTPGVGERSEWVNPDPGVYPLQWDKAFKVTSTDTLPSYTVRFSNVLAWVSPLTGRTEPMDFECEVRAIRGLPGVTSFTLAQELVNGISSSGIAETRVTYRIYPHGSDTPVDPGLFVYWCRSLNPGETVGFRASENPGVTLNAAYLTDRGIYGRDVAGSASNQPAHWHASSVIAEEPEPGELLRFTGSDWLLCGDGSSILDVADSEQPFLGSCSRHAFETPADGSATEPALRVHDETIPYDEYVQYRAVTFDVASGGDPTAGFTLDYVTTSDFYWEMQFNGIVVTRHLPTKTVVGERGAQPLPGDDVTFSVNQSLDDIPANLVGELVFEDTLPEGLSYRSAAMLVDGNDVTETVGTLSESEGTVTYRFSEAGLAKLAYGADGSECSLRITATVDPDVAPGTVLSNVASVTMNEDVAKTPEATVAVGKPADPDVEVVPPKGALLLAKEADTPAHDGSAKVDEPVTYEIRAQNDGSTTMTNLVIQDALPEGLVIRERPKLLDDEERELAEGSCEYWVGKENGDGSIEQLDDDAATGVGTGGEPDYIWAGKVVAKVPRLAPGKTVHVHVETNVAANAPTTIRNVALAEADGFDLVSDDASIKVLRDGSDPDDPDDKGSGGAGDANAQDPGSEDGSGGSGDDGTGGDGAGGTNAGDQKDGDTGGGGLDDLLDGLASLDLPPVNIPVSVTPVGGGTASSATGTSRTLPQTDAPPVIAVATTGGIGMTGAFLLSLLTTSNRRRW